MTKPTKVPGIPKPPADAPAALRSWLTSVAEAVEIRLGRRGDPKDRAVTLRELIEAGLAEELKAAPYDPNNLTSGNIGFSPSKVLDTGIPPAASDFAANAAFSQIILTWTYPNYGNHAFAEIYGHDSDVIGDAQLIGISSGRVYVDPVGSNVTRYYWIRFVSTSDVTGPWNDSSGTVATTAADVDHLLNALTDSITSSQLAQTLETEINKISGPESTNGSVAARIATEATARTSAISTASNSLQAQINDIVGVSAWSSSVSYAVGNNVRHNDKLWTAASANSNSEPTYSGSSSTNSNWTLTGDYTSLAATVASNSSAITEINNIATDSNSTAAVAIKNLQTSKEDTGVAAAAVSALSTTISSNYATSSDLSAVETAVFNDMTGVANWSSSATYAVGDRVVLGRKLYRAVATSTSQTPPNSSYWALDTLSYASAVSDLSTTLTNDYHTASTTNSLLAQKETSGAAATALVDAKAYADNNFAESTELTALESATFGNLTGLSEYNSATTYAVGDRVTFGSGANKKIYIAVATSNVNNQHLPTDTSYWSVDTLAGLADTNASISGTAASALSDAKAYTDNQGFATASDVSALEADIYEDLAGVNAWTSSTAYSAGNRVYYNRKIYKAQTTSTNVTPGTNTSKWLEDPLASSSAVSSLTTRVTSTENATTTNTTDITNLENTVNNSSTGVVATAAALSSLDTTVTSQGNSINTNSSDITNLENTVNNSSTGIVATAAALSTLTTTVNTQGSSITSTVSDVTTLSTTVGDNTTSIQTNASSINGLEGQYTVKIDANGHVAGFGLANTVTGAGSSTSEFYVNADRFAILPNKASSAAPTWSASGSYTAGDEVSYQNVFYIAKVSHTSASYRSPTNSTYGSTYWTPAAGAPFVVQANGVNAADGTYIPPGVYMNTAMIKYADIEAAKIGSVNADTIVTGTLDASRIGANTIDASKLNIDNSSITSQTVAGVPTLVLGNVAANKITSGTLDASLINVTNLRAENITGDISRFITVSSSTDVDIGNASSPTIVWEGTIDEAEFARKPYVSVTGFGLFENSDTYRISLYFKLNDTTTYNFEVDNLTTFTYTHSYGVTVTNYYVYFDGDVVSKLTQGANLFEVGSWGSRSVGTVINASYSSANSNTVVQYQPTAYSISNGQTVYVTPTNQWQEAAYIFARSNYDYHAEPFALSGGLSASTSKDIDVKIEVQPYNAAYKAEPTSIPYGTNWSGDAILEISGVMMEIR